MSWVNLVGAALAMVLVGYLVVALILPERF
ncbi:MAG TPA: K(+)-transporting ATPase subunit F [Nakamurella sp.]